MNEEKRQVLDLLRAGKITQDQAQRLLEALGEDPAPEPPVSGDFTPAAPGLPPGGKFLILFSFDSREGRWDNFFEAQRTEPGKDERSYVEKTTERPCADRGYGGQHLRARTGR